jgi:uncharacterized lipoprotein YmbA
MRRVSAATILLACLVPLLVCAGGCAARALQVHEYVLRGVVPTGMPNAAPPGGGPAVSIGPVEVPQYLRRPQIVTRIDANRVAAADSHVWAEDLSRSIARAVLTNVAVLIPTDKAWLFSGMSAGSPDFRVAIRIDDFTADTQGQALLDAYWTISGADPGDVRLARRSRLTHAVRGDGYDAVVEAMIELVGELSREIATELRALAARSQSASRNAVSLADRSSASGLDG